MDVPIELVLLLASPQHRYEGRPGDGPREPLGSETHEQIEVKAGLGIVGDRFFNQRAHRTASVTIFAIESLEHVERTLGVHGLDPQDTRRNIVTRGLDVDALRGQEFSLGGVRFRGHRPANPCAWMDVTLAPGSMRALRNRGGLRCEPLTSGILRLGPTTAQVPAAADALF